MLKHSSYATVMIAVLAMGSGCVGGMACEGDADCFNGSHCDSARKECVANDAGSVGGGGGGTVGGGSGGGVGMGGGSGGGVGGGAGGGAGGGTGGGGGTTPDAGYACDGVKAPSCDGGAYLECRTDADANGLCEFAFEALRFDLPDASLVVGPNQQVDVQVTLTRKSGFSTAYPATMAIDAGYAGQVLTAASAGVYQGQISSAAADGTRLLGATLGALTASRTFTVDAIAPGVRLWVEEAPARAAHEIEPDGGAAWKKNEKARVVVQASEHVEVDGTKFAPTLTAASGACGCDAGYCACFEMDLASQPLNAARGVIPVTLAALRDDHGNMSVSQDAGVLVTRFKWRVDVSKAVFSLTALAIAPNGTIYAGAREGTSSGVLVATSPTGTNLWTVLDGGSAYITAGPSVGLQTNKVYTALSSGTSFFRSYDAVTGAASSDVCNDTSGDFRGELAIGSSGSNEYAFAIRASDVVATKSCRSVDVSPLQGQPSIAVRRSGATDFEVFAVGDGSAPLLRTFLKANFDPVQQSNTTLFGRNVFTAGPLCGGGGGGPTTGGLYMADISNASALPSQMSTFAIASASPASPAVVAGTSPNFYALYGSTNKLLTRVAFSDVALTDGGVDFGSNTSFDAGTPLSRRAPLIGAGGYAYVIGDDSVLRVFTTSTLNQEWTMSLAPTTEVSALTIDVSRNAGAKSCAEPGVLYFVTVTGSTARLHALFVDSKGIEKNAPWPKAQHDPANTSSENTDLSHWSCP